MEQSKSCGSRCGGSYIGTPRLERVDEEVGAKGVRVERADEIGGVLDEAWKEDRVTVIDVIVDAEEF